MSRTLRARWTIGSGGFIGEVSLHDVHPTICDTIPARVELTDLYVHPLRRGQGWADVLVDTALRYAARYRWDVYLRAVPYGKKPATLERLLDFYRSKGFTPLRRSDRREMILRW